MKKRKVIITIEEAVEEHAKLRRISKEDIRQALLTACFNSSTTSMATNEVYVALTGHKLGTKTDTVYIGKVRKGGAGLERDVSRIQEAIQNFTRRQDDILNLLKANAGM